MRRLLKSAVAHGLAVSVIHGRRKPGDRWLPSDVMCAQAWQQYSDSLCVGCGNPRTESMDPESEGEWQADLPMRCHSCTSISLRAKGYQQSTAPEALYFSAERIRRSG